MHCHHTIICLAGIAAPLPLDPGRFVAFLGVAGFIKCTNRVGMLMLIGHDLLKSITHVHLIPLVQRQKLLQVSWRQPRRIRHRFDALSLEVGELTCDIGLEPFDRFNPTEAIVKLSQILVQHRFQLSNLFWRPFRISFQNNRF